MTDNVQTQIDKLAVRVESLELLTGDHQREIEALQRQVFPTPPGNGDQGTEITCPNCDGEKVIYFDERDGGDGAERCQVCEGDGLIPAPTDRAMTLDAAVKMHDGDPFDSPLYLETKEYLRTHEYAAYKADHTDEQTTTYLQGLVHGSHRCARIAALRAERGEEE